MKSPTQSPTLVPGALRVLLAAAAVLSASLGTLRGVDGRLATKTDSYSDTACEVSTESVLGFGLRDIFDATVLHGVNECVTYDDFSFLQVCDVITGRTGLNAFIDQNCTEVASEGAALPSCTQVSSSAECNDGLVCTQMAECVDVETSTISPTVVNFLVNEYNDAGCTDATGNTEVLFGGTLGVLSGECAELPEVGYAVSECRADGSYITQFFSPEDDTCSGDVWDEFTSATEFSPPVCIANAVDGLYYGYVSCTTDAETISIGATAPTIAPTGVGIDEAVTTPVPTTDDNAAAFTNAPTADVDDDIVETSAPTAMIGSRGISITDSPIADVPGSGGVEETTPPAASDDAALANGAVGTGSGVAVGVVALSCVVRFWVFIAM